MITELTPENYFTEIQDETCLHVIMCYGQTCGPCKLTLPMYESVVKHFEEYNVDNVKFHMFNQWKTEHKPFIEEHSLKVVGVPTFKYYFGGELMNEHSRSYNDPTELKKHIIEVVNVIESMFDTWKLNAE